MRTTVELPDHLLKSAKSAKTRREPPSVDGPAEMKVPTREQIDEAMFG